MPRFRSKFEQTIHDDLKARLKSPPHYEAIRVEYVLTHGYTVDFSHPKLPFHIECKGVFSAKDRTKALAVRDQNPGFEVRFVFMRDMPLRKGSKTLYSDWCRKHGFEFAIGQVPPEWLSAA